MKDLDIWVFVSVFEEMLGPFLWVMVALAAITVLAALYVLVRERKVAANRLVRSELVGLVGGVAAVLFMQAITHSSLADIGGPIDWVLTAVIFFVGGAAATIFAYAVQGLMGLGRRAETRAPAGALAQPAE